MLIRSTILGLLAFIPCGVCLRGEVEYTIEVKYGDTSKVEFPVLISLRDNDDVPVKGAIVALKRLGPNGWTEEAIVRDADTRTDKNGMILLMYPATSTRTASGEYSVDIYGAVTVVAEGHKTVTIELRKYFKDGRHTLSDDTILHLRLQLDEKPTARRKQESEAQQDAP